MTDLAAGLLQDLRERRLLPVAIGLLLALIAIPLLLHKPAESAPAPAPAAPAASSQAAPERALVSVAELRETSKLEEFSSKDPFKPLHPLGALSRDPGTAEPIGGASSSSASSGSGSSSGSGGVAGDLTGDTTGDSTGGTTDGGSGTGDTGAPDDAKTFYSYVVDLELDGKSQEDVERLTLLPSEDNPLFVFLGVSTSGKTAMFLVDSSLDQSGEGDCKPDADSCMFLYLQDDPQEDEHSFTDADDSKYELRLEEIKQQEIDPAEATSAGTAALRPIGAFLFPLVDAQR